MEYARHWLGEENVRSAKSSADVYRLLPALKELVPDAVGTDM